MSAEAYRILRNVNNLLESENAYRTVDNLGEWNGEKAPTPRYWAKADDAEVASWLDATRARIAYLAMNYARPQLAWLAKSRTPEPPHMRGLVAGCRPRTVTWFAGTSSGGIGGRLSTRLTRSASSNPSVVAIIASSRSEALSESSSRERETSRQ